MKITIVLLTALWTMSAAGSQAPATRFVGQEGTNPPDTATVANKTIRGCLNSANDTYTVIDQASGKTYKIAGDTTKLKQHIGQQVEISGEIQTIEGTNPSESSSTGETLTLGDVRQIAPTCSSGHSLLQAPARVMLAQRPLAPDANNDLNSSDPFSSNSSDTSSAARHNSTVTTNREISNDIKVTGHAGQHQQAVDTSTTGSAGETTLPPNTAPGGFNNDRLQGNGGASQVAGPSERNRRAPVPGNAVAQPGGTNPALTGNTPEEGNRAAEAAGRAEMHTNSQTGQTTFSTMPGTEKNGSPRANPKIKREPNPNQSGTNNEPK